jgi:type II secretory ATPase GspE/PulE/Tfp pilus assembly ATPase PilB-like protein
MAQKDQRELEREKKLAKIREEEEEDLAQIKAKKLGFPYANLKLRLLPHRALAVIPEDKAKASRAVVFEYSGNTFWLAAEDPTRSEVKRIRDELSRFGEIQIYAVSRSSIEKALAEYANLPKKPAEITGRIVIRPETEKLFSDHHNISLNQISAALEKIKESEISIIIEQVLAAAIGLKSSDIHFEPEELRAAVRFRLDGVLHEISAMSADQGALLTNRVKLLSGMKLNVHNRAQDGRFTIRASEKDIEVRASTTPGAYGENIVLRLLYPDTIALSLSALGMREKDLITFNQHLAHPNGMILNTGPTGSGKTTTLYAFLKEKRNPDIKIITIEDPIEYHLQGISQTQVDRDKGYDFAKGLRAALRQDPDVILVGEIRDEETARTAADAALTGHLVFSTLHTNEAAGTVSRLEELGIDRKTIAAAVRLIIAQRLVRRLCPKCKQSYQPDPALKENMLKALAVLSPKAGIDVPQDIQLLWKAVGCDDCWGLGYRGQLGLFEYFSITKRITEVMLKNASIADIRATAIDEGMITLLQDGYLRAMEGLIDLSEVARVAGETAGYIEELYEKTMAQKLRRGVRLTSEDIYKIKTAALEKNGSSKLLAEVERAEQKKMLPFAMGLGVISRATDVHIEAREHDAVIRFRIDGILYDTRHLTLELYPTLISEIKILAGLKTDIHDKIQEGRFAIMMPDEIRDVRVSVIPGGYGETAVLRILMPEGKTLGLADLGILPEFLELIEQELGKPNGIILVSGPTGSGKTTTLYALTQKLNSPAVKIITIEDPIEYRLEGILQTQIDTEQGYTFAAALRSILRQNPNIILVGEIRDAETATLAFQASLTGHLVLSTIHANDAVSVINRLQTLGADVSDIAAGLHTVISQRLTRKLCENCKQERIATPEEAAKIRNTLKSIPQRWKNKFSGLLPAQGKKITVPKAVGCEKCGFTGYRGQIGIFEILVPDEPFRSTIASTTLSDALIRAASEAGMLSLAQDGIIKVLKGITTLEEVDRIT